MDTDNKQSNMALLVMDVQGAIAKMLAEPDLFFAAANTAILAARQQKIPVIYVVVGFRKGYPEMSPANRSFAQLRAGAMQLDSPEAYSVHPSVAPQADDIIITKKRVSAFTGSDLEVVLRSLGVRHIILSGIATSGVVLSTIREAADKDYHISVLADCCADRDEEVHRVLTTKIFPRQAEVLTAEQWAAQLHS